MRTLRVGLAQINMTVGDIEGNVATILDHIERARVRGIDLLCFPEMAVTGYPPEDLLLRRSFIEDNLQALNQIASTSHGLTTAVGFVDANDDIYNAAAAYHEGHLAGVYHKHYLPNYGVFDENRYFQAGTESPIFVVAGTKVGITISEDIWYPGGPARAQALAGAEVLVTITASPFYAGKREFRQRMLSIRASDNAAILCYLNPVGGQDELVFDGGSMIFSPTGDLLTHCRRFEEQLLVWDLPLDEVWRARLHDPRRRKDKLAAAGEERVHLVELSSTPSGHPKPPLPTEDLTSSKWLEPVAEVYSALVLGTHDYVHKNGFEKVLIGLSGGIDSSLVATIAVDALGADNVIATSMPSRYSSGGSKTDAAALANNLGIRLLTISIEEPFAVLLSSLRGVFESTQPGEAEENLQARLRGIILMALSNKFGWLVLATGNKSEMATGYTTLYGDMAGGFAVIKDVPKTLVYQLATYRNQRGEQPVISQSVFEKPPTAELRPGQRDTDTLPPYEVLDPILVAYVEDDKSLEEIVALGFDEATVRRVSEMVDRNEYKRRQASRSLLVLLAATAVFRSPTGITEAEGRRCRLTSGRPRSGRPSRMPIFPNVGARIRARNCPARSGRPPLIMTARREIACASRIRLTPGRL